MIQILAVLLPLLLGLCACASLLVHSGRRAEWALALFLAPGMGVAISSVLYFFWMILFQPGYQMPVYLAVEGGLLLVLGWLALRREPLHFSAPNLKNGWQPARWTLRTWIGVVGLALLCLALANFIEDWLLTFFAQPEGNWDAWAIWNLHARFIDSGAAWRVGFSAAMGWWSHADYPLLLPGFIARVWAFLANESQYVPALVELGFLLSILGVTVSGVGGARGWKPAVFAGLFTLAVLHYSLNFQQYADMPLAFFFLVANLLLWYCDGPRRDAPGLLFLAGLSAGAAVWTKNDGWALLLALGLVEGLRAAIEKPGFAAAAKRIAWLALGCAPFLAALLVFKVNVAPPNDLVDGLSRPTVLSQLMDWARYGQIWQSFLDNFFTVGTLKVGLLPALIAYGLVVGADRPRRGNLGAGWIGLRLLLAGFFYFGIYLLTPYPLDWHLTTSMDRLICQLLPSLILMVFLMAKSLE